MTSSTQITVDQIMVRKGHDILIHEASWLIQPNQNWAIIGPNGSGKSTLVKALWGGIDICRGTVTLNFDGEETIHPAKFKDQIGYVAFELHLNILNQEDFKAEMREYCGREDEITTARDIILSAIDVKPSESQLGDVLKHLGIEYLTDRNIHALSTGEMRKALIARALMKDPKVLILDEPFDGLDEPSRKSLAESVEQLMSTHNVQVILIAHRLEEILPSITNVLLMKDGRSFAQGQKAQILTDENLSQLYDTHLKVEKTGDNYSWSFDIHQHQPVDKKTLEIAMSHKSLAPSSDVLAPEFIQMKDVNVSYGDTIALNNFSWTMKHGENWCILGPNGSGKSTIIKLITGDNLQGYANNITLFGHRKGSNQSLWDIRKKLGYVSGEVQINYRKNISAFDVICSGFYDSIGLYQQPKPEEEKIANAWIEILQIYDLMEYNYNVLSYGQKRMVLLARAMVKSPELLIVDEPCHGLDIKNRRRILDLIQRIGETPTNILYVTHHQEEILPCITNILQLEKGEIIGEK